MKTQNSIRIILALALFATTLLALTGCQTGRGPKSLKGVANETIELEIWTNREEYDLGEPVQVRAKLRNVSSRTVTLQSDSGTTPVIDIVLYSGPSLNPREQWTWLQENPDDVLYSLSLEPGKSYTVEWTPALSTPDSYCIRVESLDNAGNLHKDVLCIFYGIQPGD